MAQFLLAPAMSITFAHSKIYTYATDNLCIKLFVLISNSGIWYVYIYSVRCDTVDN